MVKDLEDDSKQLTKSLAEAKRSLKRSNAAVKELFNKYVILYCNEFENY